MPEQKKTSKKIGIISGAGTLPLILSRALINQGYEITVICFSAETQNNFVSLPSKSFLFNIGQTNKIIKTLKEEGLKEVVLIGKIDKRILFKGFRPDTRAIKLLFSLKNKSDATIMDAIVEVLNQEGIRVLKQDVFLRDCLPEKGVLGKHSPSAEESRDIEYGFNLAKQIAGLDIGQTVVVKDLIPLAIEAIEGTDEAVERGCRLAGEGAVVVKVSKENHDRRYDLPTIGQKTMEIIVRGKGRVLAVEAGKTFIVGIEEVLKLADKAGVSVVAV